MNLFRSRFSASQRGVAAIEFALITPIFLLLLLAMVEVYAYFRTISIIDRVDYSLGNLIAQKSLLIDDATGTDSNDLGVFWTVTPMLATPLDMKSNGTVIVSEIKDAGSAKPTISWQRSPTSWGQGDLSQLTAAQPLPSGLSFNASDSVVVVEVFYHFSPFNALQTFWTAAPKSMTLYRRMYFRTRFSNLDTLQSS
jgi:Flp pilus assembly pilin Flp